MADVKQTQGEHETAEAPAANPALQRLSALVGTWNTEMVLPLDPHVVVRGQEEISWLKEGPFLAKRDLVEQSDLPHSISIIGVDDTNHTYSMLYYDSRGVSRIYQMSLNSEVWKLWRDFPGFSQRFTGRFSEDGNKITACWDHSSDGTNWELDFDLTYTRNQ